MDKSTLKVVTGSNDSLSHNGFDVPDKLRDLTVTSAVEEPSTIDEPSSVGNGLKVDDEPAVVPGPLAWIAPFLQDTTTVSPQSTYICSYFRLRYGTR